MFAAILVAFSLCIPYQAKGQEIFYEDFSGLSIPPGWSADLQTANWSVANTAFAGGNAGELRFSGMPGFFNISHFISPILNVSAYGRLDLSFRHTVEHLLPGYTIGLAARNGNGPWQVLWSTVPLGNMVENEQTVSVHYTGFNTTQFQFAFFLQGNSTNIAAWYLDDVRIVVPPMHDLSLTGILNADNYLPNSQMTPAFVVSNLGQQAADQVPVICRIFDGNNNLVFNTQLITGLIAVNQSDTLYYPGYVLNLTNDFYRIEAEIQADTDLVAGNDTASKVISTLSLIPRRFVLAEVATATWCQQCPLAVQAIHDMIYYGKQIAVAEYHSSPGDPFSTEGSNKRLQYYNIQGFPTAYFDGVLSYGGNYNAYNEYVSRYNQRFAIGTPYDIRIFGTHTGNDYALNIVLDRMAPVLNPNLVLRVILTESAIAFNWQGQTQVNHVTRLVLPVAAGLPVDLVNHVQLNIPVSFTKEPGWTEENFEIIAFLQDSITKEVFQVNKRTYYELVPMGFTKIQGYVRYQNNINTPLQGVKVKLRLGGGVVAQTSTSATGYYSFIGIAPGTYYLSCNDSAPWGGNNAVDALKIMKYFVGLDTMSPLQLKAADNDVSNYVNTTDALNIMQRFVEAIPKFSQSDWVFESPVVNLPNSTIVTKNIRALCSGDVDGSFLP
ncbi:MAG TPA: hypothetical protein P5531_10315 [Bacteroidales bacterium]|nr:hypothetical protein [Bacteroidales bacterium]HSA44033.1 hypothetical protein [Bacteroidales bacterium]